MDWEKIDRERQERQTRDRAELAQMGIEWPRCGFWVDEGWRPLVMQTLKDLIAAGWDKRLAQVKQKFCGLRIYLEPPAGDRLREIVDRAEAASYEICEGCGLEREEKGLKWGRAYCNACEAGLTASLQSDPEPT
jgi:hypothetical protein